MSSSVAAADGSNPDLGCGGPSRWWLVPVAFVAGVVALAVGYFVLVLGGIVPVSPGGGPYPPFWPLFPLGFLLFWVLVVAVIRPWRWRGRWGPGSSDGPTAAEVVRLRFANGEISRDQLASMLRDLGEPTGPAGGDRLP